MLKDITNYQVCSSSMRMLILICICFVSAFLQGKSYANNSKINNGQINSQFDDIKMVYFVKPGDSLTKISQKLYGASSHWKALARFNNVINPHHIKAGDILYFTQEVPHFKRDKLKQSYVVKKEMESKVKDQIKSTENPAKQSLNMQQKTLQSQDPSLNKSTEDFSEVRASQLPRKQEYTPHTINIRHIEELDESIKMNL